jgi:hypothetical protein
VTCECLIDFNSFPLVVFGIYICTPLPLAWSLRSLGSSPSALSPIMGFLKLVDTYLRSMLGCGYGYATWIPEPPAQLPEAYIRDGVNPCDLLLLLPDGGYAYMFNCSLPKGHPKNEHGVPDIYTPFHFDYNRDCNYRPARHTAGVPISSSGSQQFEINASADARYALSYYYYHALH